MARLLYSLGLYALLPFLPLRLLYRGLRNPAYLRGWPQRLGFLGRRPPAGGVWVHAVSVGEVQAAAPVVEALLARGEGVVLTTMTPTGARQARRLFGEGVFHAFLPYDLPGAGRRFLAAVRPRLGVIMETEIWPNLLAACRRAGVPVVLANARLSARSARRYARVGALVRPALQGLEAVLAQGRDDARRFRALGVPPARLRVTGNLKYDLRLNPSALEEGELLRSRWGDRPVWIAASTHEGEEAAALAAHRRLRQALPQALLVLVPRHPERFARAAQLCARAGLEVARRSRGEVPQAGTAVYLGDTLGELPALYAAAQVAFVGGSLVPVGGHNLLEPAALGLPLLCGPHVFNFAEIARRLRRAGALRVVADAGELASEVEWLLRDPVLRAARGEGGRALVEREAGAAARVLAALSPWLDQSA